VTPTRAIIILTHRSVFESGLGYSASAVALLRRGLQAVARVGVRAVTVVDGEAPEELRVALALHELPQVEVEVVANASWRRKSGAALRLVGDRVGGPTLVLRGDRPLDDESLAALVAVRLGDADAAVVVASPPDMDLSGEYKARLGHGRRGAQIAELGLDLDDYDAVLTGHAVLTPAVIDGLAALPNPSLEDGLRAAVARGRVCAVPGRVAWMWGVEPVPEVQEQVEALLEAKAHPRYTLLNPGPVNTTARVKSALVHHDVCHRDDNFSELMVSLTDKLRRVFRATPAYTVALITGSGTAAMETALASTVPHDRKILVIDNGAFGERMVEICALHEMDVVHLRYAWGDRIDPAHVEAALRAHPDIAVVAMCHHETSVGLLNPVREVGALCKLYGALLIVDAVSSLGAEDLDVVRDHIDICYSSANKCLHAISGAGFLCVSPQTWARIEHIKPRSYYLDLKRYRRYVDELAQTPFTPAVSTYFALDAACSEFLRDGHRARWAMYSQRNDRLREGLTALGMAPFTRTGDESHSVVTCCVPEGVAFRDLYRALKVRGYIIYGCKDVLADRFLQIANMGDLSLAAIDELLRVIAEEVTRLRAEALAVETASRPGLAPARASIAL
jgi:2-aminoethylphosphonate-pyruvate transaminase